MTSVRRIVAISITLALTGCVGQRRTARAAESDGYVILGRQLAEAFAMEVGDTLSEVERPGIARAIQRAADSRAKSFETDVSCIRFFRGIGAIVAMYTSHCEEGQPRDDGQQFVAFSDNGTQVGTSVVSVQPGGYLNLVPYRRGPRR